MPSFTDQRLSIGTQAWNVRAILSANVRDLLDGPQCAPIHKAAALGEHMIETSILGIAGHLATGSPIAAFNLAALLGVLIAGSGTFLLVQRWTGSSGAAALAAVVFALHPSRLDDVAHPHVVGTHWLPWVLLSLERLLLHARASDAGLLAIFTALAALVGAYPMLGLAVFAGVFGITRVIGCWRSGSLRPDGLFMAAFAVIAAGALVGSLVWQYAMVHQWWGGAAPVRPVSAWTTAEVLPGSEHSWGMLALALAILALIVRSPLTPAAAATDAPRATAASSSTAPAVSESSPTATPLVSGPRATRVPLASVLTATVAALLVFVPTEIGSLRMPSLYAVASSLSESLQVVRAPAAAAVACVLGVAVLAGAGLAAVLARIPSPTSRALLSAVAIAAAMAEIFHPRLSAAVFGIDRSVNLHPVAPSAEVLQALHALRESDDAGAVYDGPTGRSALSFFANASPILWSAWHGRRTSACYNSIVPLAYEQTSTIGRRIRTEAAVRELAAMGFTHVAWRTDLDAAGVAEGYGALDGAGKRLAFNSELAVWRLPPPPQTHAELSALRLELLPGEVSQDDLFRTHLRVRVTNEHQRMWKLAPPAVPALAEITLTDAADGSATTIPGRFLLPLALDARAVTTVGLALSRAPQPGTYRVSARIPDVGSLATEGIVVR
ncbi:MAG TPA: hypothetical protein VEL28_04335 [Candidatus Binatia bacterium]|nr:hypothetical protein [Candidatus Binatia bacterium]